MQQGLSLPASDFALEIGLCQKDKCQPTSVHDRLCLSLLIFKMSLGYPPVPWDTMRSSQATPTSGPLCVGLRGNTAGALTFLGLPTLISKFI